MSGTLEVVRARILLAEDCPAVRQSVKALLERDQDDVVGEAGNGDEAVRMALSLRPDVVVLDRAMPLVDGFQAARRISTSSNPPHLILLTIHLAPHHVAAGIAAGIRGFVSKQDAADDLIRAVREVSRGNTFLSASATRLLHDCTPWERQWRDA